MKNQHDIEERLTYLEATVRHALEWMRDVHELSKTASTLDFPEPPKWVERSS